MSSCYLCSLQTKAYKIRPRDQPSVLRTGTPMRGQVLMLRPAPRSQLWRGKSAPVRGARLMRPAFASAAQRRASTKHQALLVFAGHVHSQVDQAVGVAPLIVVPAHKLHEGVCECDASADIEDGRGLAAHKVRGHDLFVGPIKDTLHGAGSGLLDCSYNLVVLSRLLQAASQVNH